MSLTLRENINIIRLEEINSTNLYAKANLPDIADKTLISADKQTEGHGRFNRAWVDFGKDNIFMSLVLKPSDDFKPIYANLTQYFSLVLCQIFEEYGLEPNIKWPNDVLINGKKIAGILAETVIQGSKFKGFILGAGINLNVKREDLSKITDKAVTALNLEYANRLSGTSNSTLKHSGEGSKFNKYEFLDKLINKFFENYDEFLAKGFVMIRNDYLERTNFIGKKISVQVFDEKKSGTAKLINDAGELILENDNKEIVLTMGDIL